jgi:hypothetical protein
MFSDIRTINRLNYCFDATLYRHCHSLDPHHSTSKEIEMNYESTIELIEDYDVLNIANHIFTKNHQPIK